MEHKIVKKSWGQEKWIVNNELYCLKELIVIKDEWTSKGLFHYHKLKTETFYIESGEMLLNVVEDNHVCTVSLLPGDSYTILPLTGHKFTSKTDICKCFEASTQHFDSDSYRCTLAELLYNE